MLTSVLGASFALDVINLMEHTDGVAGKPGSSSRFTSFSHFLTWPDTMTRLGQVRREKLVKWHEDGTQSRVSG